MVGNVLPDSFLGARGHTLLYTLEDQQQQQQQQQPEPCFYLLVDILPKSQYCIEAAQVEASSNALKVPYALSNATRSGSAQTTSFRNLLELYHSSPGKITS